MVGQTIGRVAVARPLAPRHKRVLDLGLLVLALPIILPVLLILALAVRLTSRGPVLFWQERVGLNGRRFWLAKFRSMCPEAEAMLPDLIAASDRDGLCFKQRSDPRITAMGRILRRTSLDELPQLWNVLRGDMSLVGPRPALPEEVARYDATAMGRLKGVPGLTGLWQVSGRADLTFDQMVALDLAYLARPSLAADVVILARTLRAVSMGRGAY